jgi:hypothetical protein
MADKSIKELSEEKMAQYIEKLFISTCNTGYQANFIKEKFRMDQEQKL